MAAPQDFADAFAIAEDGHVVVQSRSGKHYLVHEDQLSAIVSGGMMYGVPQKRHPGQRNSVFWLKPENVVIVSPVAASAPSPKP